MIVTVPAPTPVTRPVPSTVAFGVLLLVHNPPPVTSLSCVVNPTHTLVVPVIDEGKGFTVIVLYPVHPVVKV